MLVSSNTTEAPDVTEKGCIFLRKLGENWGTIVTFGIIIIWGSIYVFIFLGCHVTTGRLATYLGIFLPFLFKLVLLIWSYFVTLLTPPRQIPSRFKLSEGEWEMLEHLIDSPTDQQEFLGQLAAERQIPNKAANCQLSVCRPCRQLKPERTHHCRRCKTCVMRMDHHCPWFNNCIHFHNYRGFFCTLFYTTLIFAYVAISVLLYYTLIPQWQLQSLDLYVAVLVMVALSSVCGIVLGSFFVYHVYLSSNNRTHIENLNPETKNIFNLGSSWKNFQAIHGPWFLWWLPLTHSDNDGCVFKRARRGHPLKVMCRSSQVSPAKNDKRDKPTEQSKTRERLLESPALTQTRKSGSPRDENHVLGLSTSDKIEAI